MTRCIVPAIALLLGGPAATGASRGWAHFVSAQCRFSTRYPPGWRQAIPAPQGLEIANFPRSQAVTSVLIPITGALIQAGPAADQTKSMDEDSRREPRESAKLIS